MRWKSLLFALACLGVLDAGAANANCFLTGTQHDDYLQAPNNGCDYYILGYGGNDTMIGNSAIDCLYPGTNGGLHPGVDTMTGGSATNPDFFVWDSDPPATINNDRITDFNESKGDIIFLGGPCSYESVTCSFIGSAQFDGVAGEVRYQPPASYPGTSQIQADFTGAGTADFVINLTNGASVDSNGVSFTVGCV
jgi:hypothetical protein